MKFKIIPNQQTPAVKETDSAYLYLHQGKLLEKFLSFAMRQHNCVGLAANQVSCDSERVTDSFCVVKEGHIWEVAIAPRITQQLGTPEEKIEGCLTWLGKKLKVTRFPSVEVSYYNLKGENVLRKVTGFDAQIWQHEINHLLGIAEVFVEE